MTVLLIGLNHRAAPLALREQFARIHCTGCPDSHTADTVVLSTCNRFEVYAANTDHVDSSIERIAAWVNLPPETLRPYLYVLEDGAAVRHLMRVAAGLESMILGETQVLGQVANAAEAARAEGKLSATLARLFASAVHAGKRARSETGISRASRSVSHIAARLVHQRLGKEARVLVVGAGEMAILAARALESRTIRVINRTYERANVLAKRVQGEAYAWSALAPSLEWADAVICATRAPDVLIRADDVAARSRPLLLIDLALPRNVDPAAQTLAYVETYTLDDLQMQAVAGVEERRTAIPQVEAIVEQEAARFEQWLCTRTVAPVISDLQNWAYGVAESEVRQAINRLDDPRAEEVIVRMAHRIVGKLLHEPTMRLKIHAASSDGQDYANTVRDLFGLETSRDRG